MKLTPENALAVLVSVINRCPLSEAEKVGPQTCVESVELALKELVELKNPIEAPPQKASD